jgi:hypothetical protein
MNIRMLTAAVAAFSVSLLTVVGGADAGQTPFKGAVRAVETVLVVPPTASLTRDGTGTSTYLGKFAEHIVMTIDLPTMSSTGAATFTAANGDTVTASVVGQATPTGATTFAIVEVYTITGGTGRFAGATGTFTLQSTVDDATGISSGTFSGVINR